MSFLDGQDSPRFGNHYYGAGDGLGLILTEKLGRIENNNEKEEVKVKFRCPGNIYVEGIGNETTKSDATCHIE